MKEAGYQRDATSRLLLLTISCVLFIICGVSVSASRPVVKHKSMTRLSTGLKAVRTAEDRAKARLTALAEREEVLLAKLEAAGSDDESSPTTRHASVELAKIRYERAALNKKVKTCQLNRKCILAEMEVVTDLAQEDSGADEDEVQFVRPIKGRVTSGFGPRLHPIQGTEKPHQGLDLAGDIGDNVKCAANGKVVFAGVQRGYGNIIIVQHSDTLASAYGHLSKIDVEVGQLVAQGEKIGEVGMTGNSTGPHLHFEIRENGEPVNPTKYL